jgi:probable rRNA maturation factor
MIPVVRNTQRQAPVNITAMARVARGAIRRLRIRVPGQLAITFIDSQRMRALNRRLLRHDRTTDVISLRYDGEPIVGEILVSPAVARHYARRHGLSYGQELARYVVHGILHWQGHEDATRTQQRKMRILEDQLLTFCGVGGGGRETGGRGLKTHSHAPRPTPLAPR